MRLMRTRVALAIVAVTIFPTFKVRFVSEWRSVF
jgi:hypothetical protein